MTGFVCTPPSIMPNQDYVGLAKRSVRCALDNSTGSMLCCGGQLAGVSYSSEACYRYNLRTDTWNLLPATLVTGKKGGAIVSLGNGDFVYGGINADNAYYKTFLE